MATRATRFFILPAILAVLAAGAALWLGNRGQAAAVGFLPRLPEPGFAEVSARPVVPDQGVFTAAEARAFALLGQLDDHRIAQLPALDGETLAALPRARDLLGHQRQLPGGATPTRVGGGTLAITPPGIPPAAPAPGVGGLPAGGQVGEVARDRAGFGTAIPGPTGASPLATGPVAHDLGPQATPGRVALTAHGHEISGEGTWAAMHYVPGRDPEPVISDHGQGGYAIALFPEDPGSTRLNGGLIVPGRFYQVTGDMRVTGGAPIDVHVRPLSAVPMYAPLPCLPPAANG
nr:hypothetical protein [Planctomycetota bacterium]